MKIEACVIFFNPTENMVQNISFFPSWLEKIYVLDNSDADNSHLVADKKKVQYISFHENKGMAYALRYAAILAISDGCDYLLTMDQDSRFPKEQEMEILRELSQEEILHDYAMLGLNFNKIDLPRRIIPCKYWITSGTFLNIHNYRMIDGFREDLFIDWIEMDLGHQFHQVSKKSGYLSDISLVHEIGSPIHKNILGFRFTCMNHSPIRYYYRYRNATFLWKEDKRFYLDKFLHEWVISFWKMVIFEPRKKEKLAMIKLGFWDATKKKMGSYKEQHPQFNK